MKIGIFITARLGSSRLRRKHLQPVNDRPILWYLIQRMKNKFFIDHVSASNIKIVIATSDETENRNFEEFADEHVRVFYGSANNIPLRHLQAAQHYSLDAIISVDGDDIFCSVTGMRLVIDALNQGFEYVKTANLPFGMNSCGYTTNFLYKPVQQHYHDIVETGWSRIFSAASLHEIKVQYPFQDDLLRFTLDYPEDYLFFKTIIEAVGDDILSMSDEDIASFVLRNNYQKITEPIAKEYWENFKINMKKEQSKAI